MIAQTFQALMMAQTAGGSEGTGVAMVIFDFETFSPTTLQEVQSATNYNMSWTSGQVYPSALQAEYGTNSLLFITQAAELDTNAQLPATTYTDFTIEFSLYIGPSGDGLTFSTNRFGGSSGECVFTIGETFTGSGIWNIVITQEGVGTVVSFESAIVLETWIKFAYVVNKTADVTAIYIDGTRVATATAAAYSGTPYALTSLVFGQGGALFTEQTWMDNFRFSAGARYINPTYTVPTGPFTPD